AYIHPAVIDAWVSRGGSDSIFPAPPSAVVAASPPTTANAVAGEMVVSVNTPEDDLDADEIATLEFLRTHPTGEDEIRVLKKKMLKSIAAAREKNEKKAS